MLFIYRRHTPPELLVMLQRIFIAGFLSLQSKCNISDRTLMAIVKFLLVFLSLMAEVLALEILRDFVRLIPRSHETLCTKLSLSRNDFQEYATCLECHSLYRKIDVTSGRVELCSFIRWPQHPHLQRRQQCKVKLHTGRINKPFKVKGTYCYRPVSKYLQEFVLQNNFLEKCNAWRDREVRENYMADIYDGSVWQSEVTGYLSSRSNLYGMVNIDWFQPYKHTQHSIGAIYMVILNLPRSERFKEENIMLIGILPGPSEPHLTINSYLSSIVTDLSNLDRGILMVDSTETRHSIYRFRLLCCSSDLPATRKLGGFLSFMANHGEIL